MWCSYIGYHSNKINNMMSNSVRECLHRQRGEKTGKFAIIFAHMHIHIVYAVSEPAHLFSAYPFLTVKTNN